ncbi:MULTISPECIES: 4-hydroxy-3-methylbut-2-enyl diphosphate reductase [unclassified Methylophaga]|jgi:4-hydroxy-3-methylbut-2-enyl diphosphate reductase|uniref:4-hydroxy-3-methylbut-2-enyl diphosphate reductase n=2 Tax=Methylophaga TaxID=40222 RepID=UPI000C92756F|nr:MULTISPECIES: 4-hydroxy-3-methylbut-2-enyl diphosphate reductase [unclassified Methylophaga]MAK67680.1 4-hydroxy-3-methylbut-2-enyl diphosphate reductase [Methylophaga sp.]MAY18914.1 4-hydroxy-3-methylbut-2-enyl diphosphate reductase [Methylophaga sp.]HAO24228.1 4-hydroxy-3-methylbut-2-enyl diphosphate reductase [Methylophaga sp.]|tara:strand:+ start:4689 stop:5651 length:963 start_codon:yes stop_codon:yes gene_type:complete
MAKLVLANPRGFCAGVDRAIEIVERALELFGAPIYVRHEVVHNRTVVEDLRNKGAIFIEELSDVPDNSTLIFSAHGVSKAVQEEGKQRGLKVFDATCPLVTKVHLEVAKHEKVARECILIGHAGHPEVEGTMGQYTADPTAMYLVESPEDVAKLKVNDPNNLSFVTQTTLSVDDTKLVIDALRERFPNIIGPGKDDICYATQNRQDAVKRLAENCDLVLVVGSINSSNSNRLKELANKLGTESYLIDNADEIRLDWLKDKQNIGLTAGASAPESLVQAVVDKLKMLGVEAVTEDTGQIENIAFSLPKALKVDISSLRKST